MKYADGQMLRSPRTSKPWRKPHAVTEAEFKAGIARALEAAFMDHTNNVADGLVRRVDDGVLFIESEIDLAALADAVHAHVVDVLKPPFRKVDQ